MSKEELDGDEKPVRFSFETRIEFVVVVFFFKEMRTMQRKTSLYKKIIDSKMSRNSRSTSQTFPSNAYSNETKYIRRFPNNKSSTQSNTGCAVR